MADDDFGNTKFAAPISLVIFFTIPGYSSLYRPHTNETAHKLIWQRELPLRDTLVMSWLHLLQFGYKILHTNYKSSSIVALVDRIAKRYPTAQQQPQPTGLSRPLPVISDQAQVHPIPTISLSSKRETETRLLILKEADNTQKTSNLTNTPTTKAQFEINPAQSHIYLISRENGPGQGLVKQNRPFNHTHSTPQNLDQRVPSSQTISYHQETTKLHMKRKERRSANQTTTITKAV
ncbi:signal transduction histidine kinase [Striga asiatica]|uniref:Signal transduction histidine kinase n=1 Tax=Striga asiatica TaxID=4170 RepID=A0A5A7R5Z7_STRAF|nr:signal transduction histidine kinase [Striga asiatica]